MDGKSIGAVASYKFVKVQTAHTIEARFATAPMKDPDTGFSDIAKSDYFYDAVKWAVGSKVTSGLTETTFGPQETCTRAQTVTFLWRAAGSPVVNYAMNMTDVAAVLGISRAGVYKLAHDSRFPAFQIGKRIVVSREKFLDWLNRQCEEQKCA